MFSFSLEFRIVVIFVILEGFRKILKRSLNVFLLIPMYWVFFHGVVGRGQVGFVNHDAHSGVPYSRDLFFFLQLHFSLFGEFFIEGIQEMCFLIAFLMLSIQVCLPMIRM